MRQKINYLRHLSILILTIMIFIIGIYIGTSVEQERVKQLYSEFQDQSLDFNNIATENNYLNYLIEKKVINSTNNNVSCDLIKGIYYTSIKNLDDSRLKLENYINLGKVKVDEFSRLKKFYSNLQIDYWLSANKINNICLNSNMNTILYFYKNKKDCPSCEDEGIHLNYVKQKLKDNILIFSLDADNNEGPIKLLKQIYGVNYRELPVLVINDNIYGFKTNNEVFDILKNNSKK